MKVGNQSLETIWLKKEDPGIIQIIDQRFLPYRLILEDIANVRQMYTAIREMHVRGAPLIGAAGALGMYLSTLEPVPDYSSSYFTMMASYLKSARPTAVNLAYAVDRVFAVVDLADTLETARMRAKEEALKIIDEEREYCRQIGAHGLPIIREMSRKKGGRPVNILTHCNAGWLACIDYGTATAPIYMAFDEGIKVHVWVDETRPRNQGARLTAWELGEHGVAHTVITDNSGGYLMQKKQVDMVIVGSDRTTVTGDVANKIGTYLKALAAFDNQVPFYVALPSSSIDWSMTQGLTQIPIEERDTDEVRYLEGEDHGKLTRINLLPDKSPAANFGFDITPARLVTGLITERGVCKANRESLLKIFPEKQSLSINQ